MGYALAIGACFCCGRAFQMNPKLVPSYKGQGICLPCITEANLVRKEKSLELWPIHDDAYEPCNENELS